MANPIRLNVFPEYRFYLEGTDLMQVGDVVEVDLTFTPPDLTMRAYDDGHSAGFEDGYQS